MTFVFAIFSFAFGASIGSFVNVAALRHHTGRSLAGRSHCASCNAQIAWYDLVPVASFFLLGGRCRQCRSRLSLRYPLIECTLGLVFVAIAFRFDFALPNLLPMIYYAALWSVGAAIFLYDLQHKIIPDRFVIILGILALLIPIKMALGGALEEAIWQLFAGVLIALPFFLLWLCSQGRWMGLGDAKLALVVGWLLGLSSGIAAIMLAFWIGAAVSIVLLIITRIRARSRGLPASVVLSMQSEIPFAPFIFLGTFLVFFLELDPLAFVRALGM